MGTSATFNTSNSHVKYNIKIYQNWQSVEGNYSNVTIKVDFWRDNSGYTTYGSGTIWCKINGTTYSAGVSSSQKITNSGITLYSQTLNIGHEADGSKNLSVSAWININAPLSSGEQGFSEWLTTIPRASNISDINGGTLGNPVTVSINRATDSFTHTVIYQRSDGNQFVVGENISTSCTFTPALSDCDYLPNSTQGTAKIIVNTYSSGTYIGGTSRDFTVYVPLNIVPTINSVTLTENTAGIAAKFGGYVQGKSTIKGVISANGAYSSTIKSYDIKLNGQSFNSANFTTNPLVSSGNCTINITDTRNRTANKSVPYSIISYINPTINAFTIVRCDENGAENDEGAYTKCTLKATISPMNNKNDKMFQIFYKKLTDSTYTTINLSNTSYFYDNIQIIAADINSEYEFIFRVTDYFSSAEKSLNIGTAFTLMDFNKSGKSLAFGRVSTANTKESKIQIKMDTEIEGNLSINNKNIFDLVYPIGSIYMSVNSLNPQNLFGGTWVNWGNGRVPVGVNTDDGDFNYPEKTGGSKTHRHAFRIGMHWYFGNAAGEGRGNGTGAYRYSDGQYDGWARDLEGQEVTLNSNTAISTKSARAGGKWSLGDTEENWQLQPYITCYFWKRTG